MKDVVANPGTRLSKRAYDVVFSLSGLIILGPLLLLLAFLIKAADGGPVFFLQRRVGLGGKPFWIWKFRTMVVNAEQQGPSITRNGDARVTPIGRYLRKGKLDELPQLWNVLKGEMTLVGPRPEVARYVECYQPEQRQVLDLKPGLTDLATIEFRDEEALLASVADMELFYRQYCLPRKIELNLEYARRANIWEDTKIILKTVFVRKPAKKSIGAVPTRFM